MAPIINFSVVSFTSFWISWTYSFTSGLPRGSPPCAESPAPPDRTAAFAAYTVGRNDRSLTRKQRRACRVPPQVRKEWNKRVNDSIRQDRDRACEGKSGPDQPTPAGAPGNSAVWRGYSAAGRVCLWRRPGVVRPSRGPAAHPVGPSELRRGGEGATAAAAAARLGGWDLPPGARGRGGGGGGRADSAIPAAILTEYRDLIENFQL